MVRGYQTTQRPAIYPLANSCIRLSNPLWKNAMRLQKLDHWYYGEEMICLSRIMRSKYSDALVSSTPHAFSLKRMATAVLPLSKPIPRSMAKRHLSLCACIIFYIVLLVQQIQATDKVSLFARKGDFLLCPTIPP